LLHRYGREHGYPHLDHVTLPRIGVTQTILEELSEDKEGLVAETSHRTTQNGIHIRQITGFRVLCRYNCEVNE